MKSITLLLTLLLSFGISYAQSPQAINYQAVARDNTGAPLQNQNVSIRLSIKKDSLGGDSVFVETHAITTNNFGLINLQIGRGTPLMGLFTNISWGAYKHFVQIEIDPSGGNSYQLLGGSELLSVPYALYAESAGSSDNSGFGGTQDLSDLQNQFPSVIPLNLPDNASSSAKFDFDQAGNTFVTDYFSGTVPIGNTTISASLRDIYIAKFDLTGNLLWVITGGTPNVENYPLSLHVGASGAVYAGVQFGATTNGVVPFGSANTSGFSTQASTPSIVKLDANGNVIWVNNQFSPFTSGFMYPRSLQEVGSDLFVSGTTAGYVNLGGIILNNNVPFNSDPLLMKLDNSNGNVLGATSYSTTVASERIPTILINPANEVFLIEGDETNNLTRIAKYNTNLVFQDSMIYPGVDKNFAFGRSSIRFDSNGNLLIPSTNEQSKFISTITPGFSLAQDIEMIGGFITYNLNNSPNGDLLVYGRATYEFLIDQTIYLPYGITTPYFQDNYLLTFDMAGSLLSRQPIKVFSNLADGLYVLPFSTGNDEYFIMRLKGNMFNNGSRYDSGVYLVKR